MLFEFPKRDDPSTEDMGRRAKRFGVTCYLLGGDYNDQADALEAAFNAEGPGLLVHPTMGELNCVCEASNRTERRGEGGMATFDCTFVETGSAMGTRIGEATQQLLMGQATSAADTIKRNGDAGLARANVG
ncbi:hypothetical protein GCM10010994_55160 [Chelatococcus reniformis]|uniref:DNA circulation N-terminal domain-containing protein n=1 Tax=Chelatococcus reniformis TaxID=1494448 RepID=A0A916UVX0_9HYPH|nr:hypothetical protein GCM10010994_55160 [Chelatococcus reniformis]